MRISGNVNGGVYYAYQCKNSCTYNDTEEEAIKAWNTRVLEPLDEGEVADLIRYSSFKDPGQLAKAICFKFGKLTKG